MSLLVLKHQYPYSHPISVDLPFERVTARAVIVRRSDGALLGTRHHQGAKYALPGGGVDDGENSPTALMRELNEERIHLQGMDTKWQKRITVDFYAEYQELAIWHVITAKNAILGDSENIETRWIYQNEDVWYPQMREKIMLHIQKYVPTLFSTTSGSIDVGKA